MTKRNSPSEESPAPSLGELEREVLRLVWQMGPCTAEAVRAGLGRPLKEATVRTVLRRLEEKGIVLHTLEGRSFLYRAAEAPEALAARGVRRLADWFCNGSMEDLLVGLVDAELLDRHELKRLAEKVAAARGKKK